METMRPVLGPATTGEQLRTWYWLLADLQALARQLGVPASGPKADLVERLAAHLDGTAAPTAQARPSGRSRLTAPLTGSDVIPAGQNCSQELRAWFTAEPDDRVGTEQNREGVTN